MIHTEHFYRAHDGLKLYYRSYGSGEDVVVCLPGLTRNSKDFEGLAVHLSTRYRVISPDLRGRGQSERDPKPARYHPGTYVRDTWTLLDELGIGRIMVIGTSLGGLIAMIMADQQAQRLRGIVLNDIGPEIPPGAITRILQYAGRVPPVAGWDEAIRQVRLAYELALPGMPDEFWAGYTRLGYRCNAAGLLETEVDPAVGEALRKSQGFARLLRRLRRLGLKHRMAGVNIDTWDSFRAVTMPCLLLRGAISDVLTIDIAQRMQALKPDLEIVTVPDRGHAPLLDEALARQAIDSFLERVAASPAH